LISGDNEKRILAKIDTGAHRSSLDLKLASELGFRIVATKRVRNVSKSEERPMVDVRFKLAGKEIKTKATVVNRNMMEYPMIVGRIDLKGFLVDPCKERMTK
jgi:hypothetical protein